MWTIRGCSRTAARIPIQLVALLPADPEKRAAVTAIYREEVSAHGCNGGDAESGVRQDCLVFCWD